MRLPWQALIVMGVVFITVKLLINLLVPIGIFFLLLGLIFYFSDMNSKKVKVLPKK